MLSTPSSVFVMAFLLIPLAMSPDKRYPAGLEMSLEWKHVPQKCVQNDQAVICSFLCDELSAQFSSKREKEEKESKKDLCSEMEILSLSRTGTQ